jgi:hypothetical protein
MASIEEIAAIHQKFKELEVYVLQLIERAERQTLPYPAAGAVARPQPRLTDVPDVAQPLPGIGSEPRRMGR